MDLNQKNEQQKHLPMRKTIIEKPSFFLKFADTFTSVWCHRLLSFFILLLLGRVSRKEDLRNSYQINVRDMIALLSSDHDRVNDSNFKQKIFDAVKSMVEKVVEIQMTTTEKLKFCLFEKINNIKNSSIIEVVPTKEFLDCFLHYKNDVYFINSSHGFVKEDLSEFFKLSRYYSQKLYEYFLAFEWVPEKMISVSYDKLLAILSPPSSMRRFSNLNTFILVPAITEIREKTHFSGITMIPCKQGRNITKIDFVYNFSKPKLTLVPPLVDPSAIPHGLPLVGTSVIPHGIPLVDPSAIPHGLPLVGTSAIPHRLPLVGTSAIPHELPLVGTSAIPHGLPLVDPSAIPHGKPLANPLVIPHGIPLVNPLTKSDELSLEKIVERYTTILEGWNKVEVVDGLKDDYYIFIKKNPKASDISFWNEYFECVKNKNFVNGKTFRNKNLPWLLRYQNYCDILNNKYTNTTITNKEYNPHQNLIDSLEGKAVYWPEKNRRYILADGIDDDFNLTKVLKSDILDEYGKQYQIDLSSAKRGLADKRLVIEELN